MFRKNPKSKIPPAPALPGKPNPQIALIGIGNEFRGDDAAGLLAVRLLKKAGIPDIALMAKSGEGVELIDAWQDYDTVILFDAVQSGQHPPGHIYRLNAHREPIPADFFNYSSHQFGLAEAIELARNLGKLPKRLIVFGIEGGCFDHGRSLSGEVESAIPLVAEMALWELENKFTHVWVVAEY